MEERSSNDNPRSRIQSRRILVVDDNREAGDALASLLRFMGYEVKAVYGGAACVDGVQTFAPDTVVCDLSMPGTDGLEAARQVRSSPLGRSVLLVALSGRTSPADVQNALAAGFDVHLPKPINVAALLDVIGCA